MGGGVPRIRRESGYMTGGDIVLDGGATGGMDLMSQMSPPRDLER
jgi:hypothetical protein